MKVALQFLSTQSHNFVQSGETYHELLRRVFRGLLENHTTLIPYSLLKYAVNRLNDSMELDGLVPLVLVFGAIPSFPTKHSSNTLQQERLAMTKFARYKVSQNRVVQKMAMALK